MINYNKLVRDKIPEIISENGEKPVIRILDNTEYTTCLEKKLDEEVSEYHETREIEELADILEVVYALGEAQGYSVDKLMTIYKKSTGNVGGFLRKYF